MALTGNAPPLPPTEIEDATRRAEALIPTPYGDFRMIAYAGEKDDYTPHLALVHPDMDPSTDVIVRLHSECITGDLFGSKRCDCGEQLDRSLRLAQAGKGAVIYLRQEGRGIGIINKLKAYRLQDEGLDTIEANVHLGLEVDARHYGVAQGILEDLGIRRVQLLTNNPLKMDAFAEGPIEVVRRLPLIVNPVKENEAYLRTKLTGMGHWLR
jgi:3,4-dihydroxy 2-butanone 4-phosphate synthase/GTP cyclohydrolase II